MSENTEQQRPAPLKPGANEIAIRLDREVATSFKEHMNTGSPIEDEHKEHLVEQLNAALDTEAHEDKEAVEAEHGEQVVALITPTSARVALAALTESAPIEHGIKADLARRMETAIAS
jgi:hypothetical protein